VIQSEHKTNMNKSGTTPTNGYIFSSFEEMMFTEINTNFLLCNETVLHKPYPNNGKL